MKVSLVNFVVYEDVDALILSLILSLISTSVFGARRVSRSALSQTIEKIVRPSYLYDPSGSQTSGLGTDVEVTQHFPVCRIYEGSTLLHHVQFLGRRDIFFVGDIPIANPETSYISYRANPISPAGVKNVHVFGLCHSNIAKK